MSIVAAKYNKPEITTIQTKQCIFKTLWTQESTSFPIPWRNKLASNSYGALTAFHPSKQTVLYPLILSKYIDSMKLLSCGFYFWHVSAWGEIREQSCLYNYLKTLLL